MNSSPFAQFLQKDILTNLHVFHCKSSNHGQVITSIVKHTVGSFIHSQTSVVHPLKFESAYIVSSHTLLGMRLLIHVSERDACSMPSHYLVMQSSYISHRNSSWKHILRITFKSTSHDITMTSQWAWWRFRSPASRLFTEPFIRAQIKENIKAPRHWPLCGEFTGTGEFSAQMASNAENVSISWRHHEITLK